MDLTELAVLIRTERKRAGLSMQSLAELAGVDRTTLSRLENQRLPELGYAKLERILAVLGLEFAVRPAVEVSGEVVGDLAAPGRPEPAVLF